MKETRYFYVPDAATSAELPADEALHAGRVLRMQTGDELVLMDGNGTYYNARLTLVSNHHCAYEIVSTLPQRPQWQGHIHLAIAPTKMAERMEWMVEKSVEIGVDEISFLDCQFSERRQLKLPRFEKIAVAAMKQSRKAWLTRLNDIVGFHDFVAHHKTGHCYIAHCYEEIDKQPLFALLQSLPKHDEVTILIGPEGDFSVGEVEYALEAGYTSVHLGESRLRTETAGLSAVMMAQLSKT